MQGKLKSKAHPQLGKKMQELWTEIQIKQPNAIAPWTPGHSNHEGNDLADTGTQMAMQGNFPVIDTEFETYTQ